VGTPAPAPVAPSPESATPIRAVTPEPASAPPQPEFVLPPPNMGDILPQGLIGLIEYSYQQGIPSFLKAHLQRTPGLSVLGPEQF
jgi:hypothetical protein